MTTPKEALERAREKLVLYRAEHCGIYVGGVEYTQLIKQIDEALASLEGDAVERVARIIEPYCPKTHIQYDAAIALAKRILATGLVPDEAAIRAEATDAMVKAAHNAEIFLNMTDEGWRKAWRVMYAAAIRSGGSER